MQFQAYVNVSETKFQCQESGIFLYAASLDLLPFLKQRSSVNVGVSRKGILPFERWKHERDCREAEKVVGRDVLGLKTLEPCAVAAAERPASMWGARNFT